MVKQPPKMTALVVSAIRNLREIPGSSPKEILNYIMSEYNASNPTPDSAIERKLCTALKRGLEYGILKRVHNRYSLNTDPETIAPTEDMLMGPMERGSRGCGSAMKKRRRRKARASGRRGCKPRSRRARKRGGGSRKRGGGSRRRGGASRKRRRAAKRGTCGPSRRKSRGHSRRGRKSKGGKRRRGRRSGGGRRSRRGKSKCAIRRPGEDVDLLAKDPVETRNRVNVGGAYTYDRERERSQSRGRQSRSRSRSPSHSRSSGSSDREGNEGNRRDRQVE